MLFVFVTSVVLLGVLGWVYAILLGCQCWESRRYSRNRHEKLTVVKPTDQRVAVFVPCKGFDLQLADNLKALFHQDHDNYELVFVVESGHDPAYATISELMVQHPQVPSRLVLAGHSTHSGQKVHNLLAATKNLPKDIELLAFVDSDARPRPNWLRCLIFGLSNDKISATTGYRWLIPLRNRLANLLLYSVNSATAALYSPRGPVLLWGGSWAIRRKTFEEIGLREAWQGTLSDDLVASRVIHKAGLRVQFEPRCITASPVDTTIAAAMEFMRRQFLIGRRYSPRMWWTAFAALAVSQLALWGSLALGVGLLAAGHSLGWLGLLNFVGLYAGTSYRAWLRQDMGRICLPQKKKKLKVARRFDILAGPMLGLLNLTAFFASVCGNCITWRNIRYRIRRGGQIELLGRGKDEVMQPAEDRPSDARKAA